MVLGGGVSPGRAGLDRKCLLREGFSAPPRRRSGLWSRRRWFVGVLCSVSSASPARSLVMSSEATAQSRHPLGSAGSVLGCWVRGDVSTSALRRRAFGRHDVGFGGGCFVLGACLPRPLLVVSSGTHPESTSSLTSARSGRSGVETSPWVCQERTNPLLPWGSFRAAPTAVEALVETTCWSVGRALLGGGVPISISSQLAHHLRRIARHRGARGRVLRHDAAAPHHRSFPQPSHPSSRARPSPQTRRSRSRWTRRPRR